MRHQARLLRWNAHPEPPMQSILTGLAENEYFLGVVVIGSQFRIPVSCTYVTRPEYGKPSLHAHRDDLGPSISTVADEELDSSSVPFVNCSFRYTMSVISSIM